MNVSSNLLLFRVYLICLKDFIINYCLMFSSFSVHQDIWDEMKTRPYYLPWLTKRGINKESLKEFLRFAHMNFQVLEEEYYVQDYFQEHCYQRRGTVCPN